MDWNTIIDAALKLAATIILCAISTYVVPWINAKKAEAQVRVESDIRSEVLAVINEFVSAAEQTAINLGYDGEWKKNWVVDMVEKTLHVKVDDELDAYIESAVLLLHNAIYGEVEE